MVRSSLAEVVNLVMTDNVDSITVKIGGYGA